MATGSGGPRSDSGGEFAGRYANSGPEDRRDSVQEMLSGVRGCSEAPLEPIEIDIKAPCLVRIGLDKRTTLL